MISSFPWGNLILLGSYFNPLLCIPIKDTDWIKSLLICSSSTKNENLIISFIVVHCTVWSLSWDVSEWLYLSPFHGDWIKGPHVIHIIWVGIASKKYNILTNYTTTVSPSRWGFVWRWWKSFYLFPNVFIHFYCS